MKILHTEASGGLGGQELRTLREAEGMRARGHDIIFAVKAGGGLVNAAKAQGFTVYELNFTKKASFIDAWHLARILKRHEIEVINTHSSWDAWIGGIVAKMMRRHIIRTRHLSTTIRPGWNSHILYNFLADQVVTTCQITSETIQRQAGLPLQRCRSVPTGVSSKLTVDRRDIDAFRLQNSLLPEHIVVGTVCVLRSWKGVQHLLEAASLLTHDSRLRWVIVGDGPARDYLHAERARLGLQQTVIFTGYQSNPLPAMAAMDIFALLSTANEGVSQAVLQAAFLGRPLITTSTGGLGEICIEGKTGLICPVGDAAAIAKAVERLANNVKERDHFGETARQLVLDKFTLEKTLDSMEEVYSLLKPT